MENVLNILLAVTAVILVALVLLQGGRTDGLNSKAFGGADSLTLFSEQKSRGSDLLFERVTLCVAVVFMLIATVLAYLAL